jgi:phosphate transport system permease protein
MKFNKRIVMDRLVAGLCLIAAIVSAALLFIILGYLFIGALPVLSLNFIILPESALRAFDGAIGNAIAGTILISVFATLVATPFAFGTAVYLAKYAKKTRFTDTLRFFIEVLSGTPSIVIGIFGFLFLVVYLKPFTGGLSLIAGAIGLAILIVPVIERGAEEAISSISPELEEGSYALGATKWQTVHFVTIPAALSGIITGIILGFGRAAEESAVVLLTAGYTQFMPEFAIHANPKMFLGIQIFPLQDLVATLPLSVYSAYEHANIVPMANGFAAAFVLVCVVLIINIIAKTIANRYIWTGSRNTSFLSAIIGKLPLRKKIMPQTDSDATTTEHTIRTDSPITTSAAVREETGSYESSKVPVLAYLSPANKIPPLDAPSLHEDDTPPAVLPGTGPRKPSPKGEKSLSSLGTRIRNWFRSVSRTQSAPAPSSQQRTPVPQKEKPNPGINLRVVVLPFLIRLAPFALVAAILMVLTTIMPGLSPGGSNRPAGLLTVALTALVLCAIGTLGSLFLLRLMKRRIRNRRAGFAAVVLGIFCIFVASCIFTGHLFAPATPSMDSDSPAAPGLLGFLHLSGSATANTTDSSDKSARLAAFLAEQETPDESTPAPHPSLAPSSTAQVASSATPVVPVKNALDIGESYWYGDDSRPCLATVYKVTILPFYFWWDMDWNRFVQQTPASTGDTFLVVFIRIEDTGRMSAMVPSADQFVVTNNGQTYTHTIYFDTSVLTQDEINYYTANYNALPYQWIREIGQQKRDYAFLTGYNVFGQNWTTTDNETTVYQPSFDTNGQGYFIQPGSSNAIDGYLIYEVPDAVAADLRDTYVQVSFNSFSPTRWRLGK